MAVSIYALDDDEPEIDELAYVAPDAVVIGRVTIGPQASVWPGAVLRGDHGYITVGARTSVQDGTIVHCTAQWPTIIGDGLRGRPQRAPRGLRHRARLPDRLGRGRC